MRNFRNSILSLIVLLKFNYKEIASFTCDYALYDSKFDVYEMLFYFLLFPLYRRIEKSLLDLHQITSLYDLKIPSALHKYLFTPMSKYTQSSKNVIFKSEIVVAISGIEFLQFRYEQTRSVLFYKSMTSLCHEDTFLETNIWSAGQSQRPSHGYILCQSLNTLRYNSKLVLRRQEVHSTHTTYARHG